MKSLVTIFTLFLAACDSARAAAISGPMEVLATAGQSATVRCTYSPQYARKPKYWCRGKVYETCWVVVKTSGPTARGQTSISEDRSAHAFSVTLSSVRPQDEGPYWCVISMPFRNPSAPVYLRVLPPTDAPPTTAMGPQLDAASGSGVWATLRWILFLAMLACPLSVCARERCAGRNYGTLCPRVFVRAFQSPQTG